MSFFVELVGKPVVDADGHSLGKLIDLIVCPSEPLPVVAAGVISGRPSPRLVPWANLTRENGRYRLTRPPGELEAYEPGPQDLRIGENLLDRQIVDLNDFRVVRVNDLRFIAIDGRLCLVGVDAGLRGLLRRIGIEGLVERLAGGLRLPLRSQLIGWRDVETPDPGPGPIRLKVPHEKIARLHPADIASLVSQMDPVERRDVFARLDVETAAETLPEVEPGVQLEILKTLDDERAADILEEMEPDEAADLLGDLPEGRQEELLDAMEDEEAAEVKELLEYPDLCAGGLMTNSFVALPEGLTIGEALEKVRVEAAEVEQVYYVYVMDDDERVLGVVSLRQLILADAATPLAGVMERNIRVIDVWASVEDVSQTMAKYGLFCVPVVDEEERMQGVVTFDDVIDLLRDDDWRLRPGRSHAATSSAD